MVRFVRGLPSVDCLDTVGARVFQSALDPRVAKLKQSVEYYVQGSREGGFKSTNGERVGRDTFLIDPHFHFCVSGLNLPCKGEKGQLQCISNESYPFFFCTAGMAMKDILNYFYWEL